MQGFRRDPYLWVHLSGLAAVPLALGICLLALAVEKTFLPGPLQLLLIALFGIGPVLWMQLQRPFSIFSVLAIALRPEALSDEQRRILSWFRTPVSQAVAIVTALLMGVLFWQLVRLAPSVSSFTPLNGLAAFNVLLLASGSFLAANLFAQVPAAVLRVMVLSPSRFEAGVPYPSDRIRQDFTLLGLKLNRILPELSWVDSPVSPVVETAGADSAAAPEPAPAPATAEPEDEPPAEPTQASEPGEATAEAAATDPVGAVDEPAPATEASIPAEPEPSEET
jgi:hypothetical protein